MAKKQKNKITKAAKKASQGVQDHGPLTGAVVALGAFASAILASDKLRDASEQLISAAIGRATRALGTITEVTTEAAKSLEPGHEASEHHEHEEELGVIEPLPTH